MSAWPGLAMKTQVAAAVVLLSGLSACNTLDGEAGSIPPRAVGTAAGSVVALPRLIGELKCDFQAWTDPSPPLSSDEMAKRGRLKVRWAKGTLTLSLTRGDARSAGADLAIPIAATGLTVTPGLKASSERRTTTKVEFPFLIQDDILAPKAGGFTADTVAAATPVDCGPAAREQRLPEPILPLAALGRGLIAAPTGRPYFYPNGRVHVSGSFYLKQEQGGGFSVQFLTSRINPATLDRLSEYVQSYDICVNITGDRTDIDAGQCPDPKVADKSAAK